MMMKKNKKKNNNFNLINGFLLSGYIMEETTRAGKKKAKRDYIYDCTPISYYVF
jgi:hypothetical protein